MNPFTHHLSRSPSPLLLLARRLALSAFVALSGQACGEDELPSIPGGEEAPNLSPAAPLGGEQPIGGAEAPLAPPAGGEPGSQPPPLTSAGGAQGGAAGGAAGGAGVPPAAGTPGPGTSAGATPSSGGVLECDAVVECVSRCADDSCARECEAQATPAALTTYQALTRCLGSAEETCGGDPSCVEQTCLAPLSACGVTRAGGGAGGGALSCTDLVSCVVGCDPADQQCALACVERGDPFALVSFDALASCLSGAQLSCAEGDDACVEAACARELTDCGYVVSGGGGGGAGGGGGGGVGGGGVGGGGVSGAGTCVELADCVYACAGDLWCEQDCEDSSSAAALDAYSELSLCAYYTSCAYDDEACFERDCALELLACGYELTAGSGGAGTGTGTGTGTGAGGSCLEDLYEQNDALSAAAPLTGDMSGAGLVVSSLTLCGADDDYYAVELCANGDLTATLTFTSSDPDADVDLALYHASDVDPYTISDGVTSTEELTHTAPARPETVYLRAYNYNTDADVSYILTLQLDCP